MSSVQRNVIGVSVALAVGALVYFLPTALEMIFVGRLGLLATVLLIGDNLGCLGLCFVDWKKGLSLLIALHIAEAALMTVAGVSGQYMLYLCDAIPAAVLAIVAARSTVEVLQAVQVPDATDDR